MLNELTFRLHVSPVLSGLVMFPWKTRDVAMEKSVIKVRFNTLRRVLNEQNWLPIKKN
jgi:hypothetical protein